MTNEELRQLNEKYWRLEYVGNHLSANSIIWQIMDSDDPTDSFYFTELNFIHCNEDAASWYGEDTEEYYEHNMKLAERIARQIFDCWKHACKIEDLINNGEYAWLAGDIENVRLELEYRGDHCEASGTFDMLVQASFDGRAVV